MLESAPEPAAVAQVDAPRQGIRARALILGLLMTLVIVWLTQTLSIDKRAAEVAGDAPPPAPTAFLFLYALLGVPLLLRLGRKFSLSRPEMLAIYAMMIVAGPITHQFAIGFLVPHTVAPMHYGIEEPKWANWMPYLPSWFGPTGHGPVLGFFLGTHGAVPWAAWLVPIVAWGSLLIALFGVMLCINVIFRKQWIEHERLTFPLAAIPLALANSADSANSAIRNPQSAIRNPLFWFGLAIPLVFQFPTELHRYIPQIPAMNLKEVLLIDAGKQLSRPWNGLGEINFTLAFWLIGVIYLLPAELALSCWVFFWIAQAENVFAIAYGTTGEAPSVYSNDFPAIYAQGAGAAFALAGITLYAARRQLRAIFEKALRGGNALRDSEEFLSYRTAVFGAIAGTVFILAWLYAAGMRIWVAGLLFGLMMAYFFIFARIRAETGLGMGVILWPKMLDEVMITVVGAKYLTVADTTVLYALRWLYFGPAIGSVMAAQLEGFKLADAGGLRGRSVGRTFAVVCALTVVLALCWTLKTYYNRGFENMPIGHRQISMVGSQIYWSYQNLTGELDAPTGPQWGGIAAMFGGGMIALALSWVRLRYLWFPLHPVGFIAANSWGMHLNWATFLLGWIIKSSIIRYGGMGVYRRILPLFWGLIVGDMMHTVLWGLVTLATGGRGVN